MPSTKSLNLPQMDRKSKKPLMEKKRRARINECLSNLKNLLLECLKRDPAHTSKLEKADILEMTVHLLRDLQNQQLALSATMDNSVVYKFQHGYAECFMQVKHYADTVEGFDPSMRDRLLKHLDNRYRNIQNPIQTINPVAHIQDITHTNPSINAADTLGSMVQPVDFDGSDGLSKKDRITVLATKSPKGGKEVWLKKAIERTEIKINYVEMEEDEESKDDNNETSGESTEGDKEDDQE